MKVYIIPFHVQSMNNSIMPKEYSGAYVSCFTAGKDYTEATEKSLKKLITDNIHPLEILQPIHTIDSKDWSKHISQIWPDHAGSLPSQSEFENSIDKGEIVYGPFGLYTSEENGIN